MKASLIGLLSAATLVGTLLMPALASAHDRYEHGRHHATERWSPPAPRHSRRHDRHERWHDDRRGRWERAWLREDRPRHWSHRPHPRPEPRAHLYLGNGVSLIYR
jgi:hypothetical protein